MLKNYTDMKKKDSSYAKFTVISRKTTTASLTYVSAGYFQRDILDESGIIITVDQ
jgi:hypothetical protein